MGEWPWWLEWVGGWWVGELQGLTSPLGGVDGWGQSSHLRPACSQKGGCFRGLNLGRGQERGPAVAGVRGDC